jgi:hypothetical protein
LACRINTRRKRAARLILEARAQEQTSAFLTLTYDDDSVPYTIDSDGVLNQTLVKEDFSLWIRRVKERLPGVRYAGVGEYGDRTLRPHYHAVLFGVHYVEAQRVLWETWKKGAEERQQATEFNPERAEYLAGYTMKKMTKPEDNRLARGQAPEFFRQSVRPAIGCSPDVVEFLAELHRSDGGSRYMVMNRDVVSAVRMGRKIWPIDRTLRGYVRKALDVPERERGRVNRRTVHTRDDRDKAAARLAKTERREAKRSKQL